MVEQFRSYPAADLLVAGHGHDAPMLRDLAAGAANIRFLGAVPYTELERLIRHAIAVVVPSVGYEVFPTVVLEAFAQGTPVIGHRLGPLPEMLDGAGGLTYGNAAELCSALDALRSSAEPCAARWGRLRWRLTTRCGRQSGTSMRISRSLPTGCARGRKQARTLHEHEGDPHVSLGRCLGLSHLD